MHALRYGRSNTNILYKNVKIIQKKLIVLFLLDHPPKLQYNFITMSDNISKKSSFEKNVSKDNSDKGKSIVKEE